MDFSAAISEIPVADWAQAIQARHSVRTFTGRPVDPGALRAMEDFCGCLPGRAVARLVVVDEVPSGLFTGVIVGSYGKVVGASSALLVIGRSGAWGVQESMGYLGEAALLQATAIGLGTCWIAGSFERKIAARLAELAADEQIYAISPLGHAEQRPRRGERLLKSAVRAKSRRPLAEVAPGFGEQVWPEWAAEGVRLARIAPSAANRQPWRFSLEAGAVKVSVVDRGVGGSISRLLDVGIAMLHFEVGARLTGASGVWRLLEPPDVAAYHVAPS